MNIVCVCVSMPVCLSRKTTVVRALNRRSLAASPLSKGVLRKTKKTLSLGCLAVGGEGEGREEGEGVRRGRREVKMSSQLSHARRT